MSILLLFISFLFFSLFLLQLRFFSSSSIFVNALCISLLLVGFFAIWITKGQSIYLFPVISVMGYWIFLKKGYIKFDLNNILLNTSISILVFLIFLLLFWRDSEIFILHSDYLYWIRLIDSNLQYGVENAGTYYNAVSVNYPKNELYHYFELWLTGVGKLLNKQSTAMNLFLFAYPVGAVLLITGLKELLQTFFALKKEFHRTTAALFVFIALMFFSHPWDLFTQIFGFKKLPISSMHPWWQGFKICFVALAALPLFFYWKTQNLQWLYLLSVSVFIYPPVLPILLLTACIYWSFEWIRKKNPPIKILISLINSGLFFAFFYKTAGNAGPNVSGFAPMEWLSFSNWLRYLPAMLMKSLFIPLLTLAPVIIFLLYRWKKIELKYSLLLKIFVLYAVCMVVWMAFIKNVDANQSFLLLFTPLVCLSVALLLLHLWFRKQFIAAFLLASVYIVPEFAGAFNHQSPLPKTANNTTTFLKQIGASSILYIPDEYENKNVYQFNERVYTGIDHFIMVNPNLKLYSAAAAGMTDTTSFNSITLSTYQTFRNISPFYKTCGFVNPASDCLSTWLQKNRIQYVCAKPEIHMPAKFESISKDADFVFYELK